MKDLSASSYRNRILNSLSDETLTRLKPDLERVDMPLGFEIFRSNEKITHVYFPENSIASVVANTVDGQCVEIGVIGYEGAAGLDVVLGVDSNPHDCMIQLADGATRIRTERVRAEFVRGGFSIKYSVVQLSANGADQPDNPLQPLASGRSSVGKMAVDVPGPGKDQCPPAHSGIYFDHAWR